MKKWQSSLWEKLFPPFHCLKQSCWLNGALDLLRFTYNPRPCSLELSSHPTQMTILEDQLQGNGLNHLFFSTLRTPTDFWTVTNGLASWSTTWKTKTGRLKTLLMGAMNWVIILYLPIRVRVTHVDAHGKGLFSDQIN